MVIRVPILYQYHLAHINQRTLRILQETNVERISFTTLIEDRNGLNLSRRDIYSGERVYIVSLFDYS